MEDGVVAVGSSQAPLNNLAPRVEQNEELGADDPAPVALTFARIMPPASPLAAWVQQFNADGVAHAKSCRLCVEAMEQKTRLLQEAKQTGLFGQMRKKASQLFDEPAIERAMALSAQSLEQSQSDDFAWVKLGQRVLGLVMQSVIDTAKEFDGKIYTGKRLKSLRLFGHSLILLSF